MILDKKLLIEKGYLTFNLKDLDENLFNEFKKELTKEYLRSRIATLRVDSVILDKDVSKLKEIQEFNTGHFIIGESITVLVSADKCILLLVEKVIELPAPK